MLDLAALTNTLDPIVDAALEGRLIADRFAPLAGADGTPYLITHVDPAAKVQYLMLPAVAGPPVPIGLVSTSPASPDEHAWAVEALGHEYHGEPIVRSNGIYISPRFHGRGLGQLLMLAALYTHPEAWRYIVGASDQAARAIRALARKGLADVRANEAEGPYLLRAVRPDPEASAGAPPLPRR